MQERRTIPRTRVLKSARIILNDRSGIISCVVRNLTNIGARVDVVSTAGIPSRFELTFDKGHSSRTCRVVWLQDDRLGVAFERQAQAGGADSTLSISQGDAKSR